jgi:DNA replication protein DnaD
MEFRLKAQPGETIAVPQLVFSRLGSADETNIRVALYVIATGVTDAEKIAEDLKLRSARTAESALLWWAGAGLLEQVQTGAAVAAPRPAAMTWQQIADASRNDPMITNLVECAQNAYGRTLGRTEMQKLVGFYLQDGFDPEMMMLCISYLSTQGKTTIGALSHELKAWREEGVENGEGADKHLHLLAQRRRQEEFVRTLLKLPEDTFTLGERKAIARWYEAYGYTDDMVTEASVQAGANNQDVWYLNGILRRWYGKGLRTIHEVRGGGTMSSPEGRNIRVDRTDPSGNDFIKNAMERPHRLKRKD